MEKINEAKALIQREARVEIDKNNGHGIINIATGGGKTKILIDYISDNNLKVLWFTPSTVMRDIDTPNEFIKWGKEKYYRENVSIECYAMMHKIKDTTYDMIVLDEVHKVTELKGEFFFDNNNTFSTVLACSATAPTEEEKVEIFRKLSLKTLYTLTVDEAVNRGVIAPYELIVVKVPLSHKIMVKAGGKSKTYLITEAKHYANMSRAMAKMISEGKEIPKSFFLMRANFIYNLKSKVLVTRAILNSLKGERTLIFSKRIAIAKAINKNVYHSKSDRNAFDNFVRGNSNVLSTVDGINEGVNIPEIDVIILHQINSLDREFIQKIGRGLRYRPGYTAKIYLVIAEETKDETWVSKAISSIGEENIRYVPYTDFIKEV